MRVYFHYLLTILAIVAGVIGFTPLHAETLVLGRDDPAEWLTVEIADDEVVFIDHFPEVYDLPVFQLHTGDGVFDVDIMTGGAVAGPATLKIGESPWSDAGLVVNVRRIHGSSIQSVVLRPPGFDGGSEPESYALEVPQGKTLRLLPFGSGGIRLPKGEDFAQLSGPIDRSFDFRGPLTVHFEGGTLGGGEGDPGDSPSGESDTLKVQSDDADEGEEASVFSFLFLDNHTEMTADGYIQGPAGSFEVLVEKSEDLQTWSPSMIQRTDTGESRTFFRLRLRR